MKASLRWIGLYILHLLIATLGVGLTTAISPDGHARFVRFASGPYYPLEILLAGLTGYFCYGLLKGNHRYWVWILPTVYLAMMMVLWAPSSVLGEHNWHATWAHFFVGTPPHYPEGNITIPFFTSLSYTVGALLDASNVFRFQRPTESASS